jgi:glycosyltransferase involved in cell wall biosynthesis
VAAVISLVVPVYKNADNIPPLLAAIGELHSALNNELEAVFVVDGSPDDSWLRLHSSLGAVPFPAQLLSLSRNFGSFAAIRAGMLAARGEYIAIMAADLQEPPALVTQLVEQLRSGDYDVAVGQREARQDPGPSAVMSNLFWWFYRRFVQSEIPEGGVDIFACTRAVRDTLLALPENNSSLVGLLFWVGYRRAAVPYARRAREIGVSAWTFRKKLRYLSDSVFSFSDLPIQLLLRIGIVGLVVSLLFAVVVVCAKLFGDIPVPGYAATVLVVTFFGALNCFGLGIIGGYVWRTFENTKSRPNYIVRRHDRFGRQAASGDPSHG